MIKAVIAIGLEPLNRCCLVSIQQDDDGHFSGEVNENYDLDELFCHEAGAVLPSKAGVYIFNGFCTEGMDQYIYIGQFESVLIEGKQ